MSKSMSKTRKSSILSNIDDSLKSQYGEIIRDIEEIQYSIQKADRKKQKRAKKRMKNGKVKFYNTKSSKARIKAARKITAENIVATVLSILRDVKPLMLLIARLVAAIICAILSLDIVKRSISEKTLATMEHMYSACMGVVQPA